MCSGDVSGCCGLSSDAAVMDARCRVSSARGVRQQCSRCGQQRGWVLFRVDAAAMDARCAAVGGLAWWSWMQSAPCAPPQVKPVLIVSYVIPRKRGTCVSRQWFVSLSAAQPTERRRVQVRRPALRHKRLRLYAATALAAGERGSRADQWVAHMVIHKGWHVCLCDSLINSFVTVSRWIYASGAAAYIPSCFARQRPGCKSARSQRRLQVKK